MAIAPGDKAPEFELKDQGGDVVTLAGLLADSAVALAFYPFTFTGVCEGELCAA